MSKRKEPGKGLPALPNRLAEGPDGQFYFDIPETVQKARGPVIDQVMSQGIMEQAIILDDEAEIPPVPLPIQTRVMLSYDELVIKTRGNFKLSPFDREVLDAVATLYPGNEYITSEMIYRVMMGKQKYQYVTETQKRHVRESMERFAVARLRIDVADFEEKDSPIGRELRKRGVSAHYESYMIAFETVQLRRGDKMTDFYHILQNPVVFNYAKSLGKVSEFPIGLLDTKVNKTPRMIVLQSFLLRSIDSMYRGESSPFISIDAMYRAIDAGNETAQHKARYRNNAAAILDDWVKRGYIRGYKVHMAGRYIRGYDIQLADGD